MGQALQEQVYAAVPRIAQGLIGDEERSRAHLDRAFDHALVFLYRMLFCLHAEARGLLPVENPHYRDYSLQRIKRHVAADRDRARVFSEQADDLYNDLRALFRIVDRGDGALGVAEYNGGLFRASRYPYFEGRVVPDHLLAPALDALTRVGSEFVDYRDLSVRHLGTIYEGLLAYRLEPLDPGPGLRLSRSDARHDAGAYFTPEPVVDRIVERTLDPLLEERSGRAREEALTGEDALELFLGLRVLDPAMGSGHFLVSAAAWIAQYVATDPSYEGDLPLVELRRRVAERCLYGVDLEPMAVELAQLALWLTTVNRDRPLAFLHNLRVGNALVGADLRASLERREGTVFGDRLGEAARALLEQTAQIHGLPSRTGADVHQKERIADAVARLREPLGRLADDALSESLIEQAGPPLHWELEFPEVFLDAHGHPHPAGGFDAVLGNPPYVRIQKLGRALAEHCRRRFATASGSFDVYIPFVEQGVALLAPWGRLGFIMPNKFTKLDYGARLRERLARDGLLEEIVDFGDAQLFPGVTNYTAIVVLARAGGREEIVYRRVRGDVDAVSRALLNLDGVAGERYPTRTLGADPWVLAVGEEAALLRHLASGAERLGDVTRQIFQGLITSADPVFIVEDRGGSGPHRRVWSTASGRELLLEPDLLHPLASGADVDHYALLPLRHLLIFPYRLGDDRSMRLLTPAEFEELPLTRAYLGEHEAALRARERGRMDHDGWFGYVYPKSLGAHELPKLGVPRMCASLYAAADPNGGVYLDNVDVNGMLTCADGPSLWTLLVVLNSAVLDFVWRRGSVPFRGQFLSANKQFIAPLPIRVPGSDTAAVLDALGRSLHAAAAGIAAERQGFLDWLGDTAGGRIRDLAGWTALADYERRDLAELLAVLRRNAGRLSEEVAGRAFRERLDRERSASLARLAPLRADLRRDESAAERAVAELYELSSAQRELVARG